jgi:hypothetical protein
MIELSNKHNCFLSFDGRVVEAFGLNQSTRIHVRQIKSVQLKEKRSGYMVYIFSYGGSTASLPDVDQSQRPLIDHFLGALNTARPNEIEFKY